MEEIVSEVCHVLHQTTAFAKKRILITAGPTHGPVDAVRFLSNHSTGELGVLLAKRIYEAGGTPVLIYGPGTAVPQPYYRVESVTTPQEMMEVLTSEIQTQPYDAAIFSAAVLDHIPAHPVASKLSSNDELHIAFQKTPKLIREIDHVLKSRCENMTQKLYKIGFKLGVNQSRDELLKTAELAIEKMNVGLVVVNDLMEINHHQHHAYLVDRTFRVREVFTKDELVGELILHLKQKLNAL
ncbi:MAG: hypothetical protein HY390_00585 [Deltaproteobacteria bacterium]|nr:hypothetical protein [Deltaproteobacteria bacterium]